MRIYTNLRRLLGNMAGLNTLWQGIVAVLVAAIWAVLKFSGDFPQHMQTIQDAGLILAPAVLIVHVSMYLILYVIRRAQIKDAETSFLLKHFKSMDQFSQVFDGKLIFKKGAIVFTGDMMKYSFMSFPKKDADIGEITRINIKAFENTPWEDSFDSKMKRNLGIWTQNNLSFMQLCTFDKGLLKDFWFNSTKDSFFFSCIIPLTETGHNRYFHEHIAGDNDFREDWVAKEGEKTHSVIMFTFARDPDQARSIDSLAQHQLPFLYLRSVAVHLQTLLCRQYPEGSEATVYFQNNDPKFRRLATKLAGMDISKLKSKDNETVYVTTVKDFHSQ
ncbi:hypothetical protein [Asticcacaulis machinosus]|uniref:DUF3137 domain-containing protein n=1 Tax=Asticcacaulis machinosus TaxID=2984211 RepID=A0ABT5HGG0_9CAUL|nr:hypothetical protein [Asticcacaulis machinosus]MDC7675282.1 hypothetical protein [Asticcacaulis machinosus]